MEYLIDFLITFPADMPAERRTELLTAEADAVAELAERGHALRVWRPLEAADAAAGDDPPLHVIGLYVAADNAELEALLDDLPLAEWIAYSYTPLEPAGSDPGRK
ncbi:muconolactone Delta-isomerase family protein [Conexibacter woesei]|uniref:muconolactone Delta-isomerase family protein n=1 Tax=Conexibacter woesei TaxID=191495 RepID=UPI000423D6C3|nr:muconolactone Delta-isomerase family protein [Conexibacter woesei]